MFKPLSEFVPMTLTSTKHFGLPFFISLYYLSLKEHFPLYGGIFSNISVFRSQFSISKVKISRRVTLRIGRSAALWLVNVWSMLGSMAQR